MNREQAYRAQEAAMERYSALSAQARRETVPLAAWQTMKQLPESVPAEKPTSDWDQEGFREQVKEDQEGFRAQVRGWMNAYKEVGKWRLKGYSGPSPFDRVGVPADGEAGLERFKSQMDIATRAVMALDEEDNPWR